MKKIMIYLFSFLSIATHGKADETDWIWHTNSNYINSIALIGNYVWAGTEVGILRWDLRDNTHKIFTRNDGLPDNYIISINVDRAGSVWAAPLSLSSGPYKYDAKKWTVYPTSTSGTLGRIHDIGVDPAGNIWLAQFQKGVAKYDGIQWTNYNLGGAYNYALCIGFDLTGVPWIFSPELGLMKLNGSNWIKYDLALTPFTDVCNAIAFDKSNIAWLAASIGAIKFDGNTAVKFKASDGLAANSANDVKIDADDRKWFATSNGVSRLSGTEWKTFRMEDGLTCNHITSIAIGANRDVWTGTWGGGICKFDGEHWTSLQTDDWLPNNDVNALATDKDGAAWIATGAGVTRLNDSECITYTTNDGLSADAAYSIAVDAQNNVWLGFGDKNLGVDKFDGEKWSNYQMEDGLSSNKVYAIAAAPDGALWFATGWGGNKFDGQSWYSYTSDEGLLNNDIRTVTIDKIGNVWFGTTSGISKFDGVNWTNFSPDDGLPQRMVIAMAIDKNNHIWAGFTNSQTFRYDGESWINESSNYQGALLPAIISDRIGNIWLSSVFGVKKYNGSNWTSYSETDGLIDNSVYAITQDSSGNMWFGTLHGLCMLKAELSTSVDDDPVMPSEFRLLQNYPNPFNPLTAIRFQIPKSSDISLMIYNILGQEVRSLLREHMAEGEHESHWNGTDNSGKPVASGIYFYRLSTDSGDMETKKMVLIR